MALRPNSILPITSQDTAADGLAEIHRDGRDGLRLCVSGDACSVSARGSYGRVMLQAVFLRRRHQPRRPAPPKITPGSPAPTIGPGTAAGGSTGVAKIAPPTSPSTPDGVYATVKTSVSE